MQQTENKWRIIAKSKTARSGGKLKKEIIVSIRILDQCKLDWMGYALNCIINYSLEANLSRRFR